MTFRIQCESCESEFSVKVIESDYEAPKCCVFCGDPLIIEVDEE